MKYFLGFNLRAHDVAFYLIDEDRRLIFGIEEERLVHTRYHIISTFKALHYMLERHCIDKQDIAAAGTTSSLVGYEALREVHAEIYGPEMADRHFDFIKEEFAIKYNIWNAMGLKNARRFEVPHHLAHAVSGFAQSAQDSAVCLAMDGSGDQYTTVCYRFKRTGYEELMRIFRPNSLGWVWTEITRWMRLGRQGNEGKLMGLAAYGEPIYKDRFYQGFRLKDGRTLPFFEVNWEQGTFSSPVMREFYGRTLTMSDVLGEVPPYDEIPGKYACDIAASLQAVTNELLLNIVVRARERTGERHLVLTGGVLMNSVANGVIAREAGYESVFVPPTAGDNGTGLGAAIYAMNAFTGVTDYKIYPEGLPYIGPSYRSEEIEAALAEYDLPFKVSADVVEETCDHLQAGRIVGWFQGRMEVGARALGNRSILADPTLAGIKDTVNRKVKFREYWRPFAPIVKKDKYGEWFTDTFDEVPFMTSTHYFKPERRAAVPAVVHEDGTGRVQTCSLADNERIYRVLDGMERRNGVPIVLNTSFNIKGMPIVCSPRDAVQCYLCTEIDVLVMGDYTVRKTDHGPRRVDVARVSHPVKFFDDTVAAGDEVVLIVDGDGDRYIRQLQVVVAEKGVNAVAMDAAALDLDAVAGMRQPLICLLAAFPAPYPDGRASILQPLTALKQLRRLPNVREDRMVLLNFNGSSWIFGHVFDERQWSQIA